MNSDLFDSASFKEFLGTPITTKTRAWGQELRYKVDERELEKFLPRLVATSDYYHSSFDYGRELQELGYPQTAKALRRLRSGMPRSHQTQMGNFAEILGSEYGKFILDFDTTFVISKRFNPNADQSMKGVDILGIPGLDRQTKLLLGESKCYQRFVRDSVKGSWSHLLTLWDQEVSRFMVFYKELLRLKGDALNEAKFDRIFYSNIEHVEKCTLMLIINDNAPSDPFAILNDLSAGASLPNLICVHIYVESLIAYLPRIFQTGVE